MWLCIAIQLPNRTHRRFSQPCNWPFLQTGTQSHGEDTSQNPGRYPNKTHWGDHIFLGCRWWRTIFLHTSGQWGWVRKANTWTKRTISTKCEAVISKWGITLLENKCGRIYKDRRKHYVVFHEWNQGKCENTSRASCRSGLEEPKIEISRPTTHMTNC